MEHENKKEDRGNTLKENLYSRINISLKTLDLMIGGMVVALAFCILLVILEKM